MDSSPSSESVLDPAKCRLLSTNEKKEIVRELSKSPDTALELMNKWTRRDIMEILCVELGRDIKFESLSKDRMLDHLFKVVNGTIRQQQKNVRKKSSPDLDATNLQPPCKIQRKNDSPSLPVRRALANNAYLCNNSACRATLSPEDKFCRRCSCCICYKYDDNKDPSLWLFCTSDESVQEDSCGLSCHLECALKDERSGILQSGSGRSKKLDGGYYCTHCGKQNDLLGCWKKQLLIAKDARRLDELCYRIFLSHKLLVSTKKYLIMHTIVDTAMKKLEAEVGPITDTLDVGHVIVGRFPVGVEVQKLCTCALETLQSMFSSTLTADSKIQGSRIANCDELARKSQNTELGDLGETEVAGLKKSPRVLMSALHEEEEIPRPGAQSALISGRSEDSGDKGEILELDSPAKTPLHLDSSNLIPNNVGNLQNLNRDATQLEKESGGETGRSEDSGDKDELLEPDSPAKTPLHLDSSNLIPNNMGNLQYLSTDAAQLENESGGQTESVLVCQQQNQGLLVGPIAENENNGANAISLKSKADNQTEPSKPETEPGSSSNKSLCVKLAVIGNKDERSEASYEYYIKVIRQLERDGHIEAKFRMKFLTWFCLRATPHEKRTVVAFVDNLLDDPASLAGQLADSFSDAICSKRLHPVPSGLCVELWH